LFILEENVWYKIFRENAIDFSLSTTFRSPLKRASFPFLQQILLDFVIVTWLIKTDQLFLTLWKCSFCSSCKSRKLQKKNNIKKELMKKNEQQKKIKNMILCRICMIKNTLIKIAMNKFMGLDQSSYFNCKNIFMLN